ncbi:hypothetical protein ACLB1Q_36585 [Escherichia coli]
MLAATVQEREIGIFMHILLQKRPQSLAWQQKLAGITYSFTAHAKDIYFDYPEDSAISLKLSGMRAG